MCNCGSRSNVTNRLYKKTTNRRVVTSRTRILNNKENKINTKKKIFI